MLDRPLRLGTRKSPLALAQAEEAKSRLIAAHGLAASDVELVTVTATGDRVQDRPLAEIGGKALWTKELDAWLHRMHGFWSGRLDALEQALRDDEPERAKSVRSRRSAASRPRPLPQTEAEPPAEFPHEIIKMETP